MPLTFAGNAERTFPPSGDDEGEITSPAAASPSLVCSSPPLLPERLTLRGAPLSHVASTTPAHQSEAAVDHTDAETAEACTRAGECAGAQGRPLPASGYTCSADFSLHKKTCSLPVANKKGKIPNPLLHVQGCCITRASCFDLSIATQIRLATSLDLLKAI